MKADWVAQDAEKEALLMGAFDPQVLCALSEGKFVHVRRA